MSARKGPLESTIDSVGSALSVLFDWLGQDTKADEPPSILGLFEPQEAPPEHPEEAKDTIETEGEEV